MTSLMFFNGYILRYKSSCIIKHSFTFALQNKTIRYKFDYMSKRLNAQKIRAFLTQRECSREWLSARIKVSSSLMNQMLAGKVPKTQTLYALAQLMRCRMEDLLVTEDADKKSA